MPDKKSMRAIILIRSSPMARLPPLITRISPSDDACEAIRAVAATRVASRAHLTACPSPDAPDRHGNQHDPRQVTTPIPSQSMQVISTGDSFSTRPCRPEQAGNETVPIMCQKNDMFWQCSACWGSLCHFQSHSPDAISPQNMGKISMISKENGGEDGIRTHEGGLVPTPLAGERLKPLGHLSTAGYRRGVATCTRGFSRCAGCGPDCCRIAAGTEPFHAAPGPDRILSRAAPGEAEVSGVRCHVSVVRDQTTDDVRGSGAKRPTVASIRSRTV